MKALSFVSERLLNSIPVRGKKEGGTKWRLEIEEKERENERGTDITIPDGQVGTVRAVYVVPRRHPVTVEY